MKLGKMIRESFTKPNGSGSSNRHSLMTDPCGAFIALAVASGDVTGKYKYDDYGKPANPNASGPF